MKVRILFSILILSSIFKTALAQNEHLRFEWLGQEYIIGSVLGAGEGIDMYDTQSPNLNYTNAYLTEYDGNDSSYNFPVYGERLAMMTVPGAEVGADTLNYIANLLVQDMNWLNTPRYITNWNFSQVVNSDFYFRANIADPWVYLNPIADTLALDSAYLDPVFMYGDSTDYNGDGFVFAAQLKIVIYPLADSTTTNIIEYNSPQVQIETHTDHYTIKADMDEYILNVYDVSGKLIYVDRFIGDTYNLRFNDIQSGMYIFNLVGNEKTYTGKLYKP